MSTFSGFIGEFPTLSIDRFVQENYKSSCFLLSHCHADHMVGLDSTEFKEELIKREKVHIYCSEISKLWLSTDEKYKHLQPFLYSLPLEHPEQIETNTGGEEVTYLTCTLIPSGHCPGSVMFLLEDEERCVLYTGDFRWRIGQASRVAHFKRGQQLKRLDGLYIDTTFCEPVCYHIPNREDCVAALVKAVGTHITRNKENIVRLDCRAQLGYEFIFCELARHFKTKIHVCEWQWAKYQYIPDLACFLSTDAAECQIHACRGQKVTGCELRCGHVPEPGATTLVILPTAIYWTRRTASHITTTDICIYPEPVNKPWLLRACYSTHSSYSEIADLISYLKPKAVHANVIPPASTQKRVDDTLQQLVSGMSGNDATILEDSDREATSPEYKPLGKVLTIKTLPQKGRKSNLYFGSLDDDNDDMMESQVTYMTDEGESTDEEQEWEVVTDSFDETPRMKEELLEGDSESEDSGDIGDHSATLSDDMNKNSEDTASGIDVAISVHGAGDREEAGNTHADGGEHVEDRVLGENGGNDKSDGGNDKQTDVNDKKDDHNDNEGKGNDKEDTVSDKEGGGNDKEDGGNDKEDGGNDKEDKEGGGNDKEHDGNDKEDRVDDDDIIFVEEKPLREVPHFLRRPGSDAVGVNVSASTMSSDADSFDLDDDAHSDISHGPEPSGTPDQGGGDARGEWECIDLTEEDEDDDIRVEAVARKRKMEDSGDNESSGKQKQLRTDDVMFVDDSFDSVERSDCVHDDILDDLLERTDDDVVCERELGFWEQEMEDERVAGETEQGLEAETDEEKRNVEANTEDNDGVEGNTTDNDGVKGNTTDNDGVKGNTEDNDGVKGNTVDKRNTEGGMGGIEGDKADIEENVDDIEGDMDDIERDIRNIEDTEGDMGDIEEDIRDMGDIAEGNEDIEEKEGDRGVIVDRKENTCSEENRERGGDKAATEGDDENKVEKHVECNETANKHYSVILPPLDHSSPSQEEKLGTSQSSDSSIDLTPQKILPFSI